MAILPLSKLKGWKLADPREDLRGLQLVGEDGAVIGTITEMPVNTDTCLIETVVLDNGQAYPVRRLQLDGRAVRLTKFG